MEVRQIGRGREEVVEIAAGEWSAAAAAGAGAPSLAAAVGVAAAGERVEAEAADAPESVAIEAGHVATLKARRFGACFQTRRWRSSEAPPPDSERDACLPNKFLVPLSQQQLHSTHPRCAWWR